MKDDIAVAIERLEKATRPEEIFGDITGNEEGQLYTLKRRFTKLAQMLHPDHNGGVAKADGAMGILNNLRDTAEEKIKKGRYGKAEVTIKALHTYTEVIPLAKGDVCDVYQAKCGSENVVLKIARNAADQDLLRAEATALNKLRTFKEPGADLFHQYLPKFYETAKVKLDGKERFMNVVSLAEQGYTLKQVHAKHPHLDGRNVAWIWKRMLEGLVFVNKHGFVHGALTPAHFIVFPKNHGGQFLGWGQSVQKGQPLKAINPEFTSFYPPEVLKKAPVDAGVDIHMAAWCAQYLLGSGIPQPLASFIKACTLGPKHRYQDTAEACENLGSVLRKLYGPRKFVELDMS